MGFVHQCFAITLEISSSAIFHAIDVPSADFATLDTESSYVDGLVNLPVMGTNTWSAFREPSHLVNSGVVSCSLGLLHSVTLQPLCVAIILCSRSSSTIRINSTSTFVVTLEERGE